MKPQNVLIIKERSLCAKLSDMGISKCLLENMSSLGNSATSKYSVEDNKFICFHNIFHVNSYLNLA